ncbi:MAG: hypothetical protein WC341_10240, partial [Bacteroidales bacterium]
MVYKRFRLQITLRVLVLTITLFFIFYLFQKPAYLVSTLILIVISVAQVISLIRYTEQTNRKLARFFESIRHADFSTSFSENDLGKSFEGLNNEFNQVIAAFNKNKTEKEEHFNYLLTVIQHVSIGIIVFKRDGKVDVFNNAVKHLLQINRLRKINDLKEVSDELPERLLSMRAGDKTLFKLFVNDELLQLSMHATEFKMRGEEYILVSFQDIHPELEQKEIESWQKLIRVLTHEIMNSITPISSLAATIKEILETRKANYPARDEQEEDDIESVTQAVATIENRGKGLLNFVELYRNLTRIPKPHFRYFKTSKLFDSTLELMNPKFEQLNIKCTTKIFPQDLKILADPDLIDQVLINLILNAIDAVAEVEKPQITIVASVNL